ncbi:MAG: HAMP domain-containing sensor histidine kinase [Gemmatimonadaceae bacterium]
MKPGGSRMLTLQRALLVTVGVAILAGIIPAGIALDRRLASALEVRARSDLSLAPRVLADRSTANADMMMMHAKDFAHSNGLAEALSRNDRIGALALVEEARVSLGNIPIVIGPDGKSWSGPTVDSALIAQTQKGKMPVIVRQDAGAIQNVALAPVEQNGKWVGAAGVLATMDAGAAGVLSGLTRSDVVILSANDGMISASTLDTITTREIVNAVRASMLASANATNETTTEYDIVAGNKRRFAVTAPLGNTGTVIFTRALSDELAVLPELRRVAFISAMVALLVALLIGAFFASRIARPVQQLAEAARALGDGSFDAPLPQSRIREVERVATTFDAMRQALAQRLAELRGVNETLVDRNERLTMLQADLMQRDRLSATGRLVAQLAHEIRNPVANLRNCLELVRRRVENDAEAREFTDLAIDELLRMHELAEQMLDLNRPRDSSLERCCPAVVAREVARLASIGQAHVAVTVTAHGTDNEIVPIAPDALKQVLLNLVQNAREAARAVSENDAAHSAAVEIVIERIAADLIVEVRDRGLGIPEPILARIFDPFFTTKDAVHGVGLGLFVAEGLIRTAGARNRADGGAIFRIELPVVISNAELVSAS